MSNFAALQAEMENAPGVSVAAAPPASIIFTQDGFSVLPGDPEGAVGAARAALDVQVPQEQP